MFPGAQRSEKLGPVIGRPNRALAAGWTKFFCPAPGPFRPGLNGRESQRCRVQLGFGTADKANRGLMHKFSLTSLREMGLKG